MELFNKNKAAEQAQLTPDQKSNKLLEAIQKYMNENRDNLRDDKEKTQRLRDITVQLEQGNLSEDQVQELAQKLKNEGIEANLDTSNEEIEGASKTKSSNKKIAAYIIAALLALGVVGGGVYAYSNSGEKDQGKEKSKTEKVEGKKSDKDGKKGGNKITLPTGDSYQDHVKKLKEISERNAKIKEDLK